ncbi:hypothetical protein LCGC14_2284870 [marine sediment metagenome]|uniref:Uncharacterized protein n=1 Tax=marine sediment metagenome TaxID=412755 RepID=A0A0F9DFE9_9ZZZZ
MSFNFSVNFKCKCGSVMKFNNPDIYENVGYLNCTNKDCENTIEISWHQWSDSDE